MKYYLLFLCLVVGCQGQMPGGPSTPPVAGVGGSLYSQASSLAADRDAIVVKIIDTELEQEFIAVNLSSGRSWFFNDRDGDWSIREANYIYPQKCDALEIHYPPCVNFIDMFEVDMTIDEAVDILVSSGYTEDYYEWALFAARYPFTDPDTIYTPGYFFYYEDETIRVDTETGVATVWKYCHYCE